MSKRLTRKEREQKHKAFWDDVRAVEVKHGLRIAVTQAPLQISAKPLIREVSPQAAKLAGDMAGTSPDPWYRRLISAVIQGLI